MNAIHLVIAISPEYMPPMIETTCLEGPRSRARVEPSTRTPVIIELPCSLNNPLDGKALHTPAAAYPDRRVVSVDAHELVRGGIHCLTQQQPSAI
ncbi:hypothetical protein ABIE37_003138 [Arthrobacter bambusae]|uniref:Agmatine deiminase n=1 Tax=Arthrobacter bambusae TaxID=1338426 RepID=A0ABV2P980_9MICC